MRKKFKKNALPHPWDPDCKCYDLHGIISGIQFPNSKILKQKNYFENDYVWNYLHYNDLIIFSILHRVSTLCKPTLIPVQENFSRFARALSSQIYLATKKFLYVVVITKTGVNMAGWEN